MKAISCFVAALALTACATNLQRYAQVDHDERSITVPFGGSGLTGQVKSKLAESGWRMVVYQGPDVVRGTANGTVDLQAANTFNSRYALFIDWHQYDLCLNFQPMIRYDISLVDNESGTEVITMSGNGCEGDVANEFISQVSK